MVYCESWIFIGWQAMVYDLILTTNNYVSCARLFPNVADFEVFSLGVLNKTIIPLALIGCEKAIII